MTNKNPNREAAHNGRKPASDQPIAQRCPSEAPGPITRSTNSAGPSRRAAPERRTAPPGGPPACVIGGYRACRPKPAGRPQNAERPARGASLPAGLQGTMRGRPRLAVICHQAGSRAQEALRWLTRQCGKDPSTMPGACAAKARSPCAVRGPKTRKSPQGEPPPAGLSRRV